MTRAQILVIVLLVSLAAGVWLVLGGAALKDFESHAGAAIGLLNGVIALVGIKREGKKRKKPRVSGAKPFRLTPSFESGLFGGLIGGTLAGIINGFVYGEVFALIVVFGALTGAVAGALVQLTILSFLHWAPRGSLAGALLNEVTGGVLGGAAGGAAVGALGGWLFARREAPVADLPTIIVSASFGAVCLSLGALLYEYQGHARSIARAFLVAVLFSGLAAALGLVMLQFMDVERDFLSDQPLSWVRAGASAGLVGGIAVGLQAGLTLRLHRLWRVAREPLNMRPE